MAQIHASDQKNEGNISEIAEAINSWDAKPRNKISGILNQGGTCYLNTLLQTLLHTPDFTSRLFAMAKATPVTQIKRILQELLVLFSNLLNSDGVPVSAKALTDSFGWSADEVFIHQDIQELNRLLFEQLEITLKETTEKDLINNLYRGVLLTRIRCLVCGRVSEQNDEFLDVNLSVTNCDSVEDSLKMHTQTEKLCGENQYFCEQCKRRVDATKASKFKELPLILTLSLSRFYFNAKLMESCKLDKLCSFPMDLDMTSYLAEFSNKPTNYELFSVVIHAGANACGGHYHAYIKESYGVTNLPRHEAELVKNELHRGHLVNKQTNTNSYVNRRPHLLPDNQVRQRRLECLMMDSRPETVIPRRFSHVRQSRDEIRSNAYYQFLASNCDGKFSHQKTPIVRRSVVGCNPISIHGDRSLLLKPQIIPKRYSPGIPLGANHTARPIRDAQKAMKVMTCGQKPIGSSKLQMSRGRIDTIYQKPRAESLTPNQSGRQIDRLVKRMKVMFFKKPTPVTVKKNQSATNVYKRLKNFQTDSNRYTSPSPIRRPFPNTYLPFQPGDSKLAVKYKAVEKNPLPRRCISNTSSVEFSDRALLLDDSCDELTFNTGIETLETVAKKNAPFELVNALTTSLNNYDAKLTGQHSSSTMSIGSISATTWKSKLFLQTPNHPPLVQASNQSETGKLSNLDVSEESDLSYSGKIITPVMQDDKLAMGLKVKNSLTVQHGYAAVGRCSRRCPYEQQSDQTKEAQLGNQINAIGASEFANQAESNKERPIGGTIYGQWFDFNDDVITVVDSLTFDRVFQGPECAYMLFYKRISDKT